MNNLKINKIMKQKFEHPKVLSENGNELFFDEQGYLIKEEPKEEPKQETLEETCDRLFPIAALERSITKIPNPADFMKLGEDAFIKNVNEKLRETLSPIERQMWINGYLLALTNFKQFQEQDKNKYSEEELKSAFKIGFNIGYGSTVQELDLKNEYCDKWFEQFGKK